MRLRRPAVLAYHAIGHCCDDPHNLFVAPDVFERQMAHLAAQGVVLPLADVVAGRRGVAITFDDGYRSLLDHAVPVLERYRLPATVFVPTGHLGGQNDWDPNTGCDLALMGPDDLLAAEAAGLRAESHGHAHIDMAAASYDEVRDDVERSATVLREVVSRRPRFLAYPFGRADESAERAVRDAGMDAAFLIDDRHRGQYAFGRAQVTKHDGRLLFGLMSAGWYIGLRHSRTGSTVFRAVRPLLPARRR